MIAASQALIDLLASRQFVMADLYQIALADARTLYYTSADQPIAWNGATYVPFGPKIQRSSLKLDVGLDVDQLEIQLYPDLTDTYNGTPILAAIVNGLLDGAVVSLYTAFMATFGDTSPGPVFRFEGQVSDCTFSRTEAKITVKSWLELLNLQMPRNTYQPPCMHILYDAGCGLSKAAFQQTSTAAGGSTSGTVLCALTQASGYFAQGMMIFTAGANAGASRTVKTWTPGVAVLTYPFPNAPTPGDAFNIYPGCDLTQGTCQSKFNNLGNFRGCPYVPDPETAV
ncbi:MAG: DUF2163 domain-containing protein [Betaproteobacteria bacterium]|nr:DUF2163 domain-containing protein [Betaproteobacteria bacterium]